MKSHSFTCFSLLPAVAAPMRSMFGEPAAMPDGLPVVQIE
jgi:hypothetical protein